MNYIDFILNYLYFCIFPYSICRELNRIELFAFVNLWSGILAVFMKL